MLPLDSPSLRLRPILGRFSSCGRASGGEFSWGMMMPQGDSSPGVLGDTLPLADDTEGAAVMGLIVGFKRGFASGFSSSFSYSSSSPSSTSSSEWVGRGRGSGLSCSCLRSLWLREPLWRSRSRSRFSSGSGSWMIGGCLSRSSSSSSIWTNKKQICG